MTARWVWPPSKRTILESLRLVAVGFALDYFILEKTVPTAIFTGLAAGVAWGVLSSWIESRRHDDDPANLDIVAKEDGGEVRIHRSDDSIRDSDTVKPGNDPNSPKDRK